MFCMSCGAALPDGAVFCSACGASVTGEVKPDVLLLHQLRCSSCGSSSIRRIQTGVYRCEHCGTKFYADGQNSGEAPEETEAKLAILLSEAAAFAEKHDYHNELQTLTRAIEIAPEDNTVLLRLGRAYWRLGSFEKALEYYRIAEELYPDDPAVYTSIGAAYFKQGHYEEALPHYKKSVEMILADPMSASETDTAVAYGNYAYCLGKLGDKKNARKYLSLAKEHGYSKESIDTICRDLHLIRFLI